MGPAHIWRERRAPCLGKPYSEASSSSTTLKASGARACLQDNVRCVRSHKPERRRRSEGDNAEARSASSEHHTDLKLGLQDVSTTWLRRQRRGWQRGGCAAEGAERQRAARQREDPMPRPDEPPAWPRGGKIHSGGPDAEAR